MCGILGYFGYRHQQEKNILAEPSIMLRHRGPDDHGFEYGEGWGLGFRRLSILDLSPSGHQPMYSPDGRYCLVFNGEIYNYLELKAELERQGEVFTSRSDTEVLLRLLSRQPLDGVCRLNGMFAIAWIDTLQRTFRLARDRLGVKPLYYTCQEGQLRFASEMKALLAFPDSRREIDPGAIVQYLALNYLPNETAIFQGYHKLGPGEILQGTLDDPVHFQKNAYWHLDIDPDETGNFLSEKEFDETMDLLENAVNIRLRSDVPVGIFLSGGLDSGIVAAFAARSGQAHSLLSLTVGFSETYFDETRLAGQTANSLGLQHKVLHQPPPKISDVDRLAWYYDEPFGDPSALPTFLLCESAAEHATVFLSGDGGDELFAGYRWYIQCLRLGWFACLPEAFHRALAIPANFLPSLSLNRYRTLKLSLPDNGFAAAFDNIPNDPAILFVLHPDLKQYFGSTGDSIWIRWKQNKGNLIGRQQSLDFSLYLPDDILTKVDRASMAHSIEVRSPFLDYRLVERVANWPRSSLVNAKEGKLPLRTLAKRMLPAEVTEGSKHGFGVPLDDWFESSEGETMVRERLLSDHARQCGFWDVDAVGTILQQHLNRQGRRYGELLWRLLMLDSWARQYAERSL
jgi:asparagine synthase (glutamine-hydrolysing)